MRMLQIFIMLFACSMLLGEDSQKGLSRRPAQGQKKKDNSEDKSTSPDNSNSKSQSNNSSGTDNSKGSGSAPGTKGGGVQDLGKIKVSDRRVVLEAWDNGSEDGDIVNITLNDNPPVKNFALTNAKKQLNLNLKPGENTITVTAVNEGKVPPNTAAFQVLSGGKVVKADSWKLKTGGSGKLQIFYETKTAQ